MTRFCSSALLTLAVLAATPLFAQTSPATPPSTTARRTNTRETLVFPFYLLRGDVP